MRAIDVRAAALSMRCLASFGVRRKVFTLASGERMRLRTNDSLARRLVAAPGHRRTEKNISMGSSGPGS